MYKYDASLLYLGLKIMKLCISMFTLRPVTVRPSVRVKAKENNFISTSDGPGEGNKRFPSMDQGPEEPEKEPNPIKKFLMNFFKIKEIDHEKFRKENKWAIKIKDVPPQD
tara:strand:+ start:32 stop:361 length:330 start_codon:yes stop_codon:yes gene_type:complete